MKPITKFFFFCILFTGISSLVPEYLISQAQQNAPLCSSEVQKITKQLMDSPHWGNGISCVSCHVTHNSPGTQLSNVAGNANLCMSCHNPAGMAAAKPFSEADKARPGVSGTSHAWEVPAENNTHETQLPSDPEMSPRIMDGDIVCSTCHNQHDQTFTPFLRADNYQNALCKDCHAIRNVGSYRDSSAYKGSHPVGVVYPVLNTHYFSAPQDTNLTLVDPGRVECTTCHGVHYSDSGGANGGQGDGNILKVANDLTLCESCHTYTSHEGMDCLKCHQPHNPNKTNIFMVRDTVETPNSGNHAVLFIAETGSNSFADGDAVYDGICEVCHTETDHFRNDGSAPDQNHLGMGGQAGENCTSCHPHENSFKHGGSGAGCESCHGHDAGYEYEPGLFCQGEGTVQSHSTHTENDSDDQKGPFINCSACHDTSNYPYFISGTDLNGDGKFSLSETDACNTCHSSGGSYDGINDLQIGAKENWENGIYDGNMLSSSKEKWCATCHDESHANSKKDGSGVDAPNVIGHETDDYIYGTGWGFYETGHGLSADQFYPASGNITAGAGLNCESCHDLSIKHIDHIDRTFDCNGGCDPSEYQQSYRLKLIGGEYPMEIPLSTGMGSNNNSSSQFRLCYSCHDSGPFLNASNMNTNLVTNGSNRHQYHLNNNHLRYPADYDYNSSYNSRMTCVVCHNVHGTYRLAMVRTGALINREPGLRIWYNNDLAVTYVASKPYPPDPEDVPLSASDGTLWRPGDSGNLCSNCHGSGNIYKEYRDPFQDVEQIPFLSWTGESAYISDGVNPDSGPAQDAFQFRVDYTDLNNDVPVPIQLWIDLNDDGDYNDVSEKTDMEAVNSGDNTYYNGKRYTKTLYLSKAGDNTFNYRFYAFGNAEATGEPTQNQTVTVTNNVPALVWSGETGFVNDGVNPDIGGNGASYEFRIDYTDADNEAPSPIQIWVDENDNGLFEASEKYPMNPVDGADTDYTDGKRYAAMLTLVFAGDGYLDYRFYAADGIDQADGDPVNTHTLTVSSSANNPPSLDWEISACRAAGVKPARGANDADYEFLVNYTDPDNDFPLASGGIQVWVDGNDNGLYEETEKFNLSADNPGDTDCTNGKLYTATRTLAYVGDGRLIYRFYASDGSDRAKGEPVSGDTVIVIKALKVRPSGGAGWYSTIQAAVDASSEGSSIVVYDGTYTEDVELGSDHNRTLLSACGPDETIISGSSAGNALLSSFSNNILLDGFAFANANVGIYINSGSNITITNCKVYNNVEGLYLGNGANPVQLENSEIYSNTTRGVRTNGSSNSIHITNCDIYSNSGSGTGSAIYFNGGTQSIDFSTIRDNTNSGEGGAIVFNATDSTTTVTNTIIRDNASTDYRGGAMYFGNEANPVFDKCTISGNSATSGGGAVYVNSSSAPTFKNCIFNANSSNTGGAIFINSTGVTLINCTVTDNHATSGDGGAVYFNNGTLIIRNSIFWNNSASGQGNNISKSNTDATAVHITDSDISTSSYWIYNSKSWWDYQNNIDPAQDPLFKDGGDFHIQAGSPVINRANAAYAPADDIDGDSRPQGNAPDMGADEYK